MPVHRLKHSFSAGELSPLMESRVDFNRYNNGCKKMRNMLCTTQGPATRRSGTKFIYDLSSLGVDPARHEIRQVPFIFNENQAYTMIFFYHTNGYPYVVFGTGEGLVIFDDEMPLYCPPDPIYDENADGSGDIEVHYPFDEETDIAVYHRAPNGDMDPLVLNTDYTVTINPTLPHIVTIIPNITNGQIVIYKTTQGDVGEVVALQLPYNFDIESFDFAQSGDELYIAQSGLPPHIIKRYSHDCWELVLITFTDQPTDWSDEFGWPERVTFHQQRLAFACNLLRRQTVWMSRAGDFSDFGQEDTIVDSDAITFTLDSGTQNKIVWMSSGKALAIGTIGNEWTVVGAVRTAITPTNILAQRQTNHGSEPRKPMVVGITTLFIERYGRVVNEFVYDFNVDSYKTSDMSILSTHVTEFHSITEWAYQQTPDSVIWAVREDGVLLGITYQRQHEVLGWHIHETDGEFESITVIPGNQREDEVWLVVRRMVDGALVHYLEKLDLMFSSEDSADGRFLDAYGHYEGDPVNVITGLEYLEGKIVSVLADGTAHPRVEVIDGEIELNNMYSNVVVGLQYISELWPMLPELTREDGTSIGKMQRITNVDIDLYRTLGIYIGRWDSEDGEFEEEYPFRVPGDLTGQAVPLFTGIYHINYPEGFDRQSTYFIRQKQPLPLTVRAVVDSIEVYE